MQVFFIGKIRKFGKGINLTLGAMLEMDGGGTLQLWEDGGRVNFLCRRHLHTDGLYKVWIRGDGGEILLGTMAPEGNALTLRRSVWGGELERYGCWPVRSARCRMAYSFQKRDEWCWEEMPQRLVDRETAEIAEWSRMLYRKRQDGFQLAVPYRDGCTLPLAHLFCMAQSEMIGKQLGLIWHFDAGGHPVWP